jgi:hypothetical protein
MGTFFSRKSASSAIDDMESVLNSIGDYASQGSILETKIKMVEESPDLSGVTDQARISGWLSGYLAKALIKIVQICDR